jgi:CSLREA domain-containing protein
MNNQLSILSRSARLLLAALVLLAVLLTSTPPARAAGLTVTTLDDELNADGDCSLREAIQAANTDTAVDACPPGSGVDSISVPTGTITLSSQLPAVSSTLTITGSGAANTILQANANPNTATYRILEVTSSGNLTLEGMTMRHGVCNGSCSGLGGAIYNLGPLTVTNSTLSNNSAANYGGAIYNLRPLTVINSTFSGNSAGANGGGISSSGTLTVTNSTFSGNSAGANGGGISSLGTLTVTNSTFSGNSATYDGGAILNEDSATVINSTFFSNAAGSSGGAVRNGPGFPERPVLTVINSTLSGNTADSSGGISNRGTLHLSNTIIANSPSGEDCHSGTVATNVNNLIEDGIFGCTSALSGDPDLGPLQDNGGPTHTMALGAGSPAIDAGDDTACPSTDQRGVARPQGPHCDIGAFELEQTADTTPPAITITTPAESATYLLGQTVNAEYACQDETDGSGLASCVGDVPTGNPIDTATVGAKTFTVNATDNAGNASSASVNYSVIYNWAGFFSPVDNLPVLNTVKAGSSIPVKFSLGDDQGLDIFTAGYPKVQQIACDGGAPSDAIEETMSSGSSGLQYDPVTDTYTYVWKTQKSWAGTCRQLIVRLDDGTEHVANFKFK